MTQPATSRIVALDGVRGIAAAIVVFGHCFCIMERTARWFPTLLRTPLALFVNGPGAVQVFFVLSGFVLAGSLSRTTGRRANLRFLIRRVFRIYPPYWFAVALSRLARFDYVVPVPGDRLTSWAATYAAVSPPFTSVLAYLRWPGDAGGLIPVGWTLSVEMVFSLLLPIMLGIAVRAHWLVLIAASVAAVWLNISAFGLSYAIGFSLGVALYCERDSVRSFFIAGSGARLVLWLLGSLLLFLTPALFFPLIPAYGLYLIAWPRFSLIFLVLGAAGIVSATIGSRRLAHILAAKPLAFLGRVSYSLYLLHFPVLLLATRGLSHPPTGLDAVLLPLAVFAISLPLAAIAHRWVELPAIGLGS